MIKRRLVIGIIILAILIIGGTLFFSNKQKQKNLLPDKGESGESKEEQIQIIEIINITNENSSQQLPIVKEFSIAIDEGSINPNIINANKGDKIKIIFNFNDANIYYGGLDVYDSEKKFINIKYRKADPDAMAVEFIAEKSFVYSGYWPNTGNKKASGRVEVMG